MAAQPLPPATPEQIAELEAWYQERRAKNPASLALLNSNKPLSRLQGNASSILARLTAGDKVSKIAADLGISKPALYMWLLEHAPDEYRSVQSAVNVGQLDDSEDQIANAETMVDVAKGRELGRLAGWRLERLNKMYAPPNQNQAGGVSITVNVNRDGAAEVQAITIDQASE
mgnify:CR=1 FL=1